MDDAVLRVEMTAVVVRLPAEPQDGVVTRARIDTDQEEAGQRLS